MTWMTFMWLLMCLQYCSASGVPSGVCGCVGLGKCPLARLTMRKYRLSDSDLYIYWELNGKNTTQIETYTIGLFLWVNPNKNTFSALSHVVFCDCASPQGFKALWWVSRFSLSPPFLFPLDTRRKADDHQCPEEWCWEICLCRYEHGWRTRKWNSWTYSTW